jgi:hypothetical protein
MKRIALAITGALIAIAPARAAETSMNSWTGFYVGPMADMAGEAASLAHRRERQPDLPQAAARSSRFRITSASGLGISMSA